MLDLQKAKQKSQHRGDLSDTVSAAGFDRALGSIGSTLAASDVWRQGPGPTLDLNYAGGRPEDLFTEFEPDVFGKGVVTSMILEAESTPSLEKGRVSESETV